MDKTDKRKILRGDIYYADLNPVVGSEQGGIRPVLIIQNDTGNQYSPTVIVAAITGQSKRDCFPTHVKLDGKYSALLRTSTILLEQIRTLDKRRLLGYIGHIDQQIMDRVDQALTVSVGTTKQNI